MKATTKIDIVRDGDVRWSCETDTHRPAVVLGATNDIADYSKLRAKSAAACIYCDSTDALSNEHPLPYALGGTVIIHDGSCETCRKTTQEFEQTVLRGPMQMARYKERMQSRTRHRDVSQIVPIKLAMGDREVHLNAPRDDAPILLPFPIFALPDYADLQGSGVKLTGVTGCVFGPDVETFAKKNGANGLEIRVVQKDAIAFARMIAKIAYGVAFVEDLFWRIKDRRPFVKSMMQFPETLGRFVGTLAPPFVRYFGLRHRFAFRETDGGLLVAEVQLFASAGAPTYVVILGELAKEC